MNIGGLQVGMKKYRILILILIILAIAIWLVIPDNPGIKIGSFAKEISTHLGLDLVGGVQVLMEADLPETTEVTNEAMGTATSIVENRVNGLGVSEAVVQRVGNRRISVELPGIEDPEQAISAVRSTGLLEFVDMSTISQAEAVTLVGQTIQTDYQLSSTTPVTTTASLTETSDLTQRIWPTALTGAALKTASVTTNQLGQYEVAIEFTDEGGNVFAEYTGNHINDVLAIVLDKKVISVPTINDKIEDGKGVITGSFTNEEANQLAVQLRYGALPVPLKVIETRTVGPTLGQDSLQKSLVAGLIGAVLVMAFMAIYYRIPGLIADMAIIFYAIITFALYRTIPVTLTLAGIAGFLLSTGSALDANILIFERFKEELRAGRSLMQSIDQGFQRAWPSIRDSNIATLLTCAVLYIFGSQSGATIVIGFAFTLAVGVFVSLFTAILVTRTLLSLILGALKPTNFSKWFGI
jgi:preprotein translocase subunit SecD